MLTNNEIHLDMKSSKDYSAYHYEVVYYIMVDKKVIGFLKGIGFKCIKMNNHKQVSKEDIFNSLGYVEKDLLKAFVLSDEKHDDNKELSKEYKDTFKSSVFNCNHFLVKEFYMEKYFRDRGGFSLALELLPYYICKNKKNFIETIIVHNPQDRRLNSKMKKYFNNYNNFKPLGQTEFLFHNILNDINQRTKAIS